jgi:predicted dehydrogenase
MRIGVIGLGFMGLTHLKAIKNLPQLELAAVSTSDPKKLAGDLRDVGGNLGISGEEFDFSAVGRYPDWKALIADPNVEAVDICTPTDSHEEIALAALSAGKHVLVEKPMSLTYEGCQRILAAAKTANRIVMAAQVLRFFPMYTVLRKQQLGSIQAALFRRRCAAPNWSKWLLDPGKSGGAAIDLLIHDLDFCLHLFGKPEAVSATGIENLSRGIDVITANLHYPNVASVVVTGGWHHPAAYPFSMEYTVSFEQGTVDYSSAFRPVTLYRETGVAEELKLDDVDGYQEEIRYFADCAIAGKQPELCPPQESAQSVALARLIVDARRHPGEKIAF